MHWVNGCLDFATELFSCLAFRLSARCCLCHGQPCSLAACRYSSGVLSVFLLMQIFSMRYSSSVVALGKGWGASWSSGAREVGGGAGFTLVEMLVVLVISSLAAGLLMQASSHVLGLQARLNAQLDGLRGPALGADWLRQVVQGLQPDYPDGAHRFKGTARGFAGLTTNPLSGGYGGLEPFAVVLDRDEASDSAVLRYATGAAAGAVASRLADPLPDESATQVLLRLPGPAPRLLYWDERGGQHEDWPPLQQGRWQPLPSRITLEGEGDLGSWVIVATHQGPLWPTLRPRDVSGVMGGAP